MMPDLLPSMSFVKGKETFRQATMKSTGFHVRASDISPSCPLIDRRTLFPVSLPIVQLAGKLCSSYVDTLEQG